MGAKETHQYNVVVNSDMDADGMEQRTVRNILWQREELWFII